MRYVTVGNGSRIHLYPYKDWNKAGGWTLCYLWADALVVHSGILPGKIYKEDICRNCLREAERGAWHIPDSWIAAAAGEGPLND